MYSNPQNFYKQNYNLNNLLNLFDIKSAWKLSKNFSKSRTKTERLKS